MVTVILRTFAPALMYCVVDIETTGGNKHSGRITEIAAFLFDGSKVVDTFTSLVNPKTKIPSFITGLTGITNEMVANAPTFEEIAQDYDRFSANAIFVAHNVNFDYGFIREEFRRLNMNFTRRRLCTVQLSRKHFPGLPSYSLDKITRELNIVLDDHHRAEADARATLTLFGKILNQTAGVGLFDAHFGIGDLEKMASPHITSELLRSIPDDTGVFRFFNQRDELIYTKRSTELLSAICGKLTPNETQQSTELSQELYRIDWEVTGSKLLAQLLEAEEVLAKNPKFNHGKFSMKAFFGLFAGSVADKPYLYIQRRQSKDELPLQVYANYFEALHHLKYLADRAGTSVREGGKSKGITGFELMDGFEQVEKLLGRKKYWIVDEAPVATERIAIFVDGMQVVGYGKISSDDAIGIPDPATTLEYRFEHFPELELVVRAFLAKKRYETLIKVPETTFNSFG